MRGDAELFADTLQSYLIDPHGSGRSTPPDDPTAYSPEGNAAFYEEVVERSLSTRCCWWAIPSALQRR
jgi:hypothetical protein